MQYKGETVSVLAANGVRYIGRLYTISSKHGMIQIENVECVGTEDRVFGIYEVQAFKGIVNLSFKKENLQTITLLSSKKNITMEILTILDQYKEVYDIHAHTTFDIENEDESILFTIGLIADPQYAIHQNKYSFDKDKIRRYKNALTITKNAVETWNNMKHNSPKCIICLGDIIDGMNKKRKK